LSYLHFIRTALLDEQSPLHTMRAGATNNTTGERHAT
jgi:hypothetical protein